MEWFEFFEDLWEEIKNRGYYIAGVALIIFLPSILGAANTPKIPLITDIYAIVGDIGLFGSTNFFLAILSLCAIWGIFAASWDILSGYTGQISFGHAIFFGLSAYVGYWTSTGIEVDPLLVGVLGSRFSLTPALALMFSGFICALLAVSIGILALRVKGPYLALVTLVIPLIAASLFKLEIFYSFTGGDHGFPNVPSILSPTGNLETDTLNFYIFAISILLVSVGIMMLVAYSRYGLIFQAIREDEDAAESLGINLAFYKILAFTISAFFAGIAGGMYAQYRHIAVPSFFDSTFSFSIIIMCVIGGIGSISGGVVGAFLLTILTEILLGDIFPSSILEGVDILVFGLLLVITLRYMPYGLARAKSDQKKAVVVGMLFALAWAIIPNSNFLDYLSTISLENILLFLAMLLITILTLPAIPVFFVSEFLGLFVLENLMGLSLSAKALIKAKFVIYCIAGIPFAYYLPKLFKILRLRFWGVWPSVGRYEPE
ncbi:MAG: branched-chain amino acid ABC transporter permease [Candidatus Hodarchaeales archaeon]